MWPTLGQKRGHALTKIFAHIGADNQVLSQNILAPRTSMMLQASNGFFGDLEGQGRVLRYLLGDLTHLMVKLVGLKNFIDQTELQGPPGLRPVWRETSVPLSSPDLWRQRYGHG